ncbi:hypothetical protein AHAS_Ahas09G0137100 [Arachis hypogaea]
MHYHGSCMPPTGRGTPIAFFREENEALIKGVARQLLGVECQCYIPKGRRRALLRSGVPRQFKILEEDKQRKDPGRAT